MKYSIFGYLIGEGFRNFFKNKKSTAASIIIMCATMFIFGIFFLIGENVNYIIEQVQSDQAMQVFINPEATQEQEAELERQIRAIQEVNTVDYVSQEQALNEMKSWLGEDAEILDPYSGEDNPFKASYVITLTDLTDGAVPRDGEIPVGRRTGAGHSDPDDAASSAENWRKCLFETAYSERGSRSANGR